MLALQITLATRRHGLLCVVETHHMIMWGTTWLLCCVNVKYWWKVGYYCGSVIAKGENLADPV